MKFPIQTSLSVVTKLPVCVRSGEKCQKFRKTSTPPKLGKPRINKKQHHHVPSRYITGNFIV